MKPGLPHCRWILYQLSHRGSPRILEWVAYPFCSESSRPRNRAKVSALQADSLQTREPEVGMKKCCHLVDILCNYNMTACAHSVQFSSVAQSCPTLCHPMDCSTPGFPVHHQLPKLTQIHVHHISDAIQPSHPLFPPSSALNLSQHQGLFQRVGSSHQVATVLEFQLQHQSFP